jgi:hypothetical protein
MNIPTHTCAYHFPRASICSYISAHNLAPQFVPAHLRVPWLREHFDWKQTLNLAASRLLRPYAACTHLQSSSSRSRLCTSQAESSVLCRPIFRRPRSLYLSPSCSTTLRKCCAHAGMHGNICSDKSLLLDNEKDNTVRLDPHQEQGGVRARRD